MKVLVTGATGFLGSHLCRELREEGHEVTLLRRATSDGNSLSNLEVRDVVGDVTDAESVNRAVREQEVVIHAAALVRYGLATTQAREAVNVGGTRNVVVACQRFRVARLVHVSSVAAIGIPEDRCRPADETFGFNLDGSPLGYHVSKRRAEHVVARAVADGLDAVIVNPSSMHGPHGPQFRGSEAPDGVRRHRIVPYFSGGTNVVHVGDVVDGILAVLRRGCTGERYILGGQNLTWRQMATIAADRMGVRRIFVRVPAFATGLTARSGRAVEALTGHPARLTYDAHFCANRFLFYDSQKAREKLGFKPRPYTEIVQQYLNGGWHRAARRGSQ